VLAHKKLNAEMQNHSTAESKHNLPCMDETMQHRVVRTVVKDGREVWLDEPPDLHPH